MSSKASPPLDGLQPIIVCNRGPVAWRDGPQGGRISHEEGGGVILAMSSLAKATDAIWVAMARGAADRELVTRSTMGPLVDDTGAAYRMGYITPTDREYHQYYNVIANPLLWFVQHSLWDLSVDPQIDHATMTAWRDGYVRINQLFADQVVRQARGSERRPVVMLQDYHLYLAPAMIRQRLPDALIQHFVHIPWPEPGAWQVLPTAMRHQILEGMLGNDIIGFQTPRDAANFAACCAIDLGLQAGEGSVTYKDRTVELRDYPISVNTKELDRLMADPETQRFRRELQGWRPEKLIVAVDRKDLSKNVLRRNLAYAQMLEDHPQWRGRVQFWQFLQPTRTDIPQYAEYARKIEQQVIDINARFGTPTWQPIVLEQGVDMRKAVAGFMEYDLLVVNPVADGMNLVIKDGMYCNQRNGAAVLSSRAGAARELGEAALLISPFDIGETAETMHRGLVMSPRQRQVRSEAAKRQISRNDMDRWMDRQLRDIQRLGRRPLTPPEPELGIC